MLKMRLIRRIIKFKSFSRFTHLLATWWSHTLNEIMEMQFFAYRFRAGLSTIWLLDFNFTTELTIIISLRSADIKLPISYQLFYDNVVIKVSLHSKLSNELWLVRNITVDHGYLFFFQLAVQTIDVNNKKCWSTNLIAKLSVHSVELDWVERYIWLHDF